MNRYVVTVLLFLCPATSLFAVAEEVPAPDWASYSEEVNLSATDWLDNSGNAFQLWTGTVQVVENGENQEYEVSVTWNPQALSAQITVGGQSVNSSTDYSTTTRASAFKRRPCQGSSATSMYTSPLNRWCSDGRAIL